MVKVHKVDEKLYRKTLKQDLINAAICLGREPLTSYLRK
jgi:hypothetical protein